MSKVEWNKPTSDRAGKLVYVSKDGRFVITKRKYVLPTASVGYVLEGAGVPRWARENDQLRDAKQNAQDIADSEVVP